MAVCRAVCLLILAAILLVLELSATVTANPMKQLVTDSKKTVVFLGREQGGQWQVFGTGFLIRVRGVYCLVTAKHVVYDSKAQALTDGSLLVFVPLKSGKVDARSLAMVKKKHSVDWFFHNNPSVDVALIPFDLNPTTDDVKVIDEGWFLGTERLFELYDVFFPSYQPGVDRDARVAPVVRSGMISRINDDKTFYIDAFAFPGNSGSPVFLKHAAVRFEGASVLISGDPIGGKFVGLVGEYVPYQETAFSAQTGRARVMFEENTGLARIWSVDYITAVADTAAFKATVTRLLDQAK